MKYLYEWHMGGWYVTDNRGNTYCPICEDEDKLVGSFSDGKEMCFLILKYLAENEDSIDVYSFLKELRYYLKDEVMFVVALDNLQDFGYKLFKTAEKMLG